MAGATTTRRPSDWGHFGVRRCNHELMVRGTFANVRLRNAVAPGTEGPITRVQPTGEQMTIFEASEIYRRRTRRWSSSAARITAWARRATGRPRAQLLGAVQPGGAPNAADIHVANRVGRLGGEPDEQVLLAAALAVRAARLGSVYVDLAAVHRTVLGQTTNRWTSPRSRGRHRRNGARRAGPDPSSPTVPRGSARRRCGSSTACCSWSASG